MHKTGRGFFLREGNLKNYLRGVPLIIYTHAV